MKKIMMVILDGFGISNQTKGNAIKQANTPFLDKIMSEFPNTELIASGEDVGLPKGQMGNSEVGHITIGSGRTIKQPLTIINEKIKSKEMFNNDKLIGVMEHVKKHNSKLHLIGLFSNGGVHSTINHFYATLALAKLKNIDNVCMHIITDGRDTAPTSGKKFIADFLEKTEKLKVGRISTISGRYYSMDRDNNLERTKKAYNAICYGIGNEFQNYASCLDEHYKRNITDEFINPSIINRNDTIDENDGVIFVNFRDERMKQLIDALITSEYKGFKTKQYQNLKIASLFNIHESVEYAYEMEKPLNTIGRYIDGLDYRQARIAETEKYPHVTHFFDGGYEFTSQNCDKFLIQSPKVATYDQKPEMSLGELTETAFKVIEDDYDFILINFANLDMVGHTGNFKAAVDAAEISDFCLSKIYDKAVENFYEVIVTADHGNAECMIDKNGDVITSHTTNKVPFILCNTDYELKQEGTLKDIAPTITDLYEIKKPDLMTGESLIIKEDE